MKLLRERLIILKKGSRTGNCFDPHRTMCSRICATPLSVIGTVRKQMLKTLLVSASLSMWTHREPVFWCSISVKFSFRSETVDSRTRLKPLGTCEASLILVERTRDPTRNILKIIFLLEFEWRIVSLLGVEWGSKNNISTDGLGTLFHFWGGVEIANCTGTVANFPAQLFQPLNTAHDYTRQVIFCQDTEKHTLLELQYNSLYLWMALPWPTCTPLSLIRNTVVLQNRDQLKWYYVLLPKPEFSTKLIEIVYLCKNIFSNHFQSFNRFLTCLRQLLDQVTFIIDLGLED